LNKYDCLWYKKTLSGIIHTKTQKNTFKNGRGKNSFFAKKTPKDDLETFCNIISHITAKNHPDEH